MAPVDDGPGCPRCGGCGLATVWHTRPNPDRRIPETTAAYCECAEGRRIEFLHRERSPDVRKRIPDLVDVLAGRSAWLAEMPGMGADGIYSAPKQRRQT